MKLNNSNGSSNNYNNYNNYSNDNSNVDCINEKCENCQRHFVRIEDVFVSLDSDRYYHIHCAKELNIKVTVCRDI